MPDRYINLSSAESRALNAGASVLIVPMQTQPDHCHRDIIGKPKPWSEEDWSRLLPQIGDKQIAAPFSPGDILHAREAWRYCDECTCMNYRANGPDGAGVWHCLDCDAHFGQRYWRSARSMPAWATRHKHPVKSVSAIRLPEIGEEDAIRAGFSESEPMTDEELESLPTDELELASHLGPGVFTAKLDLMMFWSKRYPKLPWESWAWRVEVER